MCRNLLQPFWVDCVLFNGDDRYQLCLWRNFVFPFFNAFFIINSIFSWRRYAESSTTEYYLIVFSFLKMFKNFFLKKTLWPLFVDGVNYLKATVPQRGDSLLFKTKSLEVPSTHFINLGMMKSWVDLGATLWFQTWEPWIRNPVPFELNTLFCFTKCIDSSLPTLLFHSRSLLKSSFRCFLIEWTFSLPKRIKVSSCYNVKSQLLTAV